MNKFEKAPAWAFEIDGKLCYWAQPTKHVLIKDLNSDSDSYKPVAVYIVRRKDLNKKRRKKK